MPELPEVETVAAGVHERVRGERIESVWLSGKKEPFKTPAAEMAEGLKGRTIERVYRVGKHIVLDLSPLDLGPVDLGPVDLSPLDLSPLDLSPLDLSPVDLGPVDPGPLDLGALDLSPAAMPRNAAAQWIVHLGMTGRLLVCAADVAVPAHTHAQLRLSSGRELRFVDARRFGRLALHLLPVGVGKEESGSHVTDGRFSGPGKEPLTISSSDFAALFRKRKTPIKAALLNQKLLHGVGNIYADESLFRAGIRPRRMAGRLTRVELERLQASLQSVLREAIRLGGSSVSDYVDADGVRGFFQLEHRVYQRGGEPCLVCTTPIRRIIVGGRGTHYCPACQK